MPSFDVVSKLELAEVENAVNQARKELAQRYDFRGTNTELESTPEGLGPSDRRGFHAKKRSPAGARRG